MLHAETEYRRGVIGSNLLLLGVEPNPLTNDRRLGAGSAPDSKRHLESNREDALASFARTVSESIPVCISMSFGDSWTFFLLASKLVGGSGSFILRRDITSHV